MMDAQRGMVKSPSSKPELMPLDGALRGMTRDSSTVFRKALYEKMNKNPQSTSSEEESEAPRAGHIQTPEDVNAPTEALIRYVTKHILGTNAPQEEVWWFLVCYRKWTSAKHLFAIWVDYYKYLQQTDRENEEIDRLQPVTHLSPRQRAIRDTTKQNNESKKERASSFLITWLQNFDLFDFPKKQQRKMILSQVVDLGVPRVNNIKLIILRNTNNAPSRPGLTMMPRSEIKKMNGTNSNASDHPIIQSSGSLTSLKKLFARKNSEKQVNHTLRARSKSSLVKEVPHAVPANETERDVNVENHISSVTDILSTPASIIAASITMDDSQMFCSITPVEFMTRIKWAKAPADAKGEYKNIDRMVQRFNFLSKWVITEILKRAGNKAEQKLMLEKFIEIAKRCESLNNFNGVLAILSGLSAYTVHRLKTLWSSIGEKHLRDFQQMESLMNPARNFVNYQKELEARKSPILPYLGLFLRNLTFLAENPVYIEKAGNTTYVNDEVIHHMGKILEKIQMYQKDPYQLVVVPEVIKLVLGSQIITEENHLYELSLQSEPDPNASVAVSAETEEEFSVADSEVADISTLDDLDDEKDKIIIIPSPKRRMTLGKGTSPFQSPRMMSSPSMDGNIKKLSRSTAYILRTVAAPAPLSPMFATMEQSAFKFFSDVKMTEGTLMISGERYLVVRHSQLREWNSDDNDVHPNMLTQIGYFLGLNDAKYFKSKLGLHSPMEQLAFGMIHTACTGLGVVSLENITREGGDGMKIQYNIRTKGSNSEFDLPTTTTYLTGYASEAYETPFFSAEEKKGNNRLRIIVSDRESIERATEHDGLTMHITDIPRHDVSIDLKRKEKKKKSKIFRDKRIAMTRNDEMNQVYKNAVGRAELYVPTKLRLETKMGKISFEGSRDRYAILRSSSLSADYVTSICERLGDQGKLQAAMQLDSIGRSLASTEYSILFENDKQRIGLTVPTSRSPGEINSSLELLERFHMLPAILNRSYWGRCTISKDFSFDYNKKNKTVEVRMELQMLGGFEPISWQENSAARWSGPSCCVMTAAYISQWATRCFGMKMESIEYQCKCSGNQRNEEGACKFILTESGKIESLVSKCLSATKSTVDPQDLIGVQLYRARSSRNGSSLNAT